MRPFCIDIIGWFLFSYVSIITSFNYSDNTPATVFPGYQNRLQSKMAELKAYLAEKNNKKSSSFLGSSAASDGESDTAGLLSWVPTSVNISMPSVFGKNSTENTESSSSSWLGEAKNDPFCPSLV